MKQHFIKNSRKGILSVLFTFAMLAFVLGCLVHPKKGMANAEETTFYAETIQMKQLDNGSVKHYNVNPNNPNTTTFNSKFSHIAKQGDTAFRAFADDDYDIAVVWTAPENGTFYVQNNNGVSKIRVASNISEDASGYTEVAIAKGKLQDGKLALTSLTDTGANDKLFKKIDATANSVTQTDVSVNATYSAPLSIQAGESFVVIIKRPSYLKTNGLPREYRAVQVSRYFVHFTPTGGEKTAYEVDGKCVAEVGTAATRYVSYHAVKNNSYTTDANGTYGQTGVSQRIFTDKSPFRSALVPQDGKVGQWFISNTSENHSLAVNGSTCKVAPGEKDTAVTWKAPENGELLIDKLYLENSYESQMPSNAAEDNVEQDAKRLGYQTSMNGVANGINAYFAYVDNGGSSPVYYDLLPSGSPQLIEPALTVAERSTKPLNLNRRKVTVKQGDEIILIINRNGSMSYDSTIMNWQMTLNGKMYALRSGVETISEQNTYGFTFSSVSYLLPQFDVSKAYKFGKIVETDTVFAYNARGEGNSCFWNGELDNYIQPSTERVDGHPKYLQSHPQKGKNVAFVYTADGDCQLVFDKVWIQKRRVDSANTDGFRFAFLYKSVDGANVSYYSVRESIWELVQPKQDAEVYRILENELPTVKMKSGDSLMIVYDNNKTTDYDTQDSYINATCYYDNGTVATHNLCDEITIAADNASVVTGHWSIKLLQMASDYSDMVLGEASDLSEALDVTYTTEALEWDLINKKYISTFDGDISVSKNGDAIEVMPGVENCVAFAYTASEKGRILVGDDSYVNFLNDGFSNGIRLRVLKNETVVYPSAGGWKNYLDEKTFYLKDMPVVDVEKDDQIIFVIDSFGEITSDTAQVDFIVHFAKEGENYTKSSQLSAEFASPQENKSEWSYLSLLFDDADSSVIDVSKGAGGLEPWLIAVIAVGSALVVAGIAVTVIVVIKKKKGGSKKQ